MDLRLLEIFCCVFEERGFSKAAQRLFLTQPTVSGHIKSLEDQLGVTLFDRLGREVRPTRAGELLYEHGRQIIQMKKVMMERMAHFLNRLEGELKLGGSTIPGEYLLPAIIGAFRSTHPGIQVSLMIADTKTITGAVGQGDIELGFVGARVTDPHLEFSQFATDRLVLVVPRTQKWERINSISLSQLKKEPLLIRPSGSGTRIMVERKLTKLGYQLKDFNIVAELGSTTAIKEAIRAQVGASILSSLAVQSELETGLMKVIRIREMKTLQRDFFTVVNVRRATSPLCEAFLEHLSPTPT